MAESNHLSNLCNPSELLNIAGDVKISVGELANLAGNTEQSILTSLSADSLFISGSSSAENEMSFSNMTSVNSTVGGIVLNSDGGVATYISQQQPQSTSATNIFPNITTDQIDFHSATVSENSQQAYIGNANVYQVTMPPQVANNEQLLVYNDVLKVEDNQTVTVPQPTVHALSLGQVLAEKAAPLGSSQNPIRIVQQGNQYMPLQNLTQEQLAQVMQVVQQQQFLTANLSSINQSNVFMNPQSQNKIVYKVCYPNQTPIAGSISNSINRDMLTQQKKQLSTESTDIQMRLDKERKKKHRPRTRCGRVSKPPQYMVKDYKHIHPVDYDEDYDDSDGGYSDFKMSSGEEEVANKMNVEEDSFASASLKSKRFKCDYCDKSYVGKGGLNRHYKLYPTHGKPDEDVAGNELGDSYYSSDSLQSGNLASGSTFGNGDFSSVSQKRTRIGTDDGVTLALEVFSNGEPKQKGFETYGNSSRRGKRGRPPTLSIDDKRRLRLFEAAKACTDEDILDLFVQRCSSTVSLWNVLSVKNTKVYDSSVDSLLTEVSNLHEQISSYLTERLQPLPEDNQCCEDGDDLSSKNIFEMVDEKLAVCLNLPIGKYAVRSDESLENSFQSVHQSLSESSSTHIKDQLPLTSSTTRPMKTDYKLTEVEQSIVLPPRKRLKLSEGGLLGMREFRNNIFVSNDENATASSPSNNSHAEALNTTTTKSAIRDQAESLVSYGKNAHERDNNLLKFNQTFASSSVMNRYAGLMNLDDFQKETKVPGSALKLEAADDSLVSSSSQLSEMIMASELSKSASHSQTTIPISSSLFTFGLQRYEQPEQNNLTSEINDLFSNLSSFGKTQDGQHAHSQEEHNLSSSSLTVPNSVLDHSSMQTQQHYGSSDHATAKSETDSLGFHSSALSCSNIPEISSQPQQVSVACFPMQDYIHIQENARYVQTEDGLVVVKNSEDSYQIYGNLTRNITLESLQALFEN